MGFLYSCSPANHPEFHTQSQLSDISEEEFKEQWQERKYTWYHRIYHIICFFVFLGPIRLFIILPVFILNILVVIIIRYLQLEVFKVDRKYLKRPLYLLLCLSIRFICLAFGHIHIRIKGKVDPDTRIFIANHTAFHDPFIASYVHPCSVVCKKELGDGILKYMLDVLDPIYVRRDIPGGATKLIINQANNPNEFPVLIYPEGTLTNGDITLFFHKGAFLTDKKVQAFYVRYHQPLVPQGWNSYAWTQNNTAQYIFDCLCMPLNIVDVRIMPPQSVSDFDGTPEGFAKNAELQMANFFGTKATTRSSNEIFRKKKETNTEKQTQQSQENQKQKAE